MLKSKAILIKTYLINNEPGQATAEEKVRDMCYLKTKYNQIIKHCTT